MSEALKSIPMGSPITFSGFNQIDFNVVLNAIMQQESAPLQALQARQSELKATDSTYGQLVTKLDALRTSSGTLSNASTLTTYAATSSDTTALSVSASSSAVAGRYEVKVNELARAQVTVSTTFAPDTDTTVVATGGSLTIGTEQIAISGPVTLQQLAAAINADANSPAGASIIATEPGKYRLVLTGKNTGAANAFTIANQLTAGTIAFADADNNNISGDSASDNAVSATDASLLINNIAVTSTSNTLDSAIPGVALTLQQADPAKTVVVNVARDDQNLADRVKAFVATFNDIVKFADAQAAASNNGTTGAIGRDSVLRGLRSSLRNALLGAHGSAAFTRLAEVGIGFTRTGELTLDQEALTSALSSNPGAVQSLFADSTTGAFTSINSLIDDYTDTGGFLPDARSRLSDEIARVGRQMDDMSARLAVRRAALQQEFTAADEAMTRLNSQKSSLSSLSSDLISSNF
jgi:flagellar hook-associated protein 2